MQAARVLLQHIVLLLFVAGAACAQATRPVAQLTPAAESDGAHPGAPIRLALHVKLPAGIHVQSNAPRDPGLVPTALVMDAFPDFEIEGTAKPAGTRLSIQRSGPMIAIEEIVYPQASDLAQAGQEKPLAVFGEDFVIGILASVGDVEPGSTLTLRGHFRYQACDDKVCYLPVTADATWTVRVVPSMSAVKPQQADVFSRWPKGGVTISAIAPALVADVRAAIAAQDPARAEQLVAAERAAHGISPEMLVAHSWLGRGELAAGRLDPAETYAKQTYDLATAELKKRPLDQETQLPVALGAAIEVRGQVLEKRGDHAGALAWLNSQARAFAGTSIEKRIEKNLNLISLVGTPAPELDLSEFQGIRPPTLASLKGRVVVLFFWAHWCPDCKAQGPVLEKLLARYGAQGLTIVAPTQRYGYAAGGALAPAAEETQYIAQVRRTYYPWLAQVPVPVGESNHIRYGVSTTPTLVLVDRAGLIKLYHPGQMTEAELDPLIQGLL